MFKRAQKDLEIEIIKFKKQLNDEMLVEKIIKFFIYLFFKLQTYKMMLNDFIFFFYK